MYKKFTTLFTAMVIGLSAMAFQPSDYALLLKSGTIYLPEGQLAQSLQGPAENGMYYRVVQFYAVPTQNQKKDLEDLGVQFLNYLPKNAFLMAIPAQVNMNRLNAHNIRSIARLTPKMKSTPIVFSGEFPEYSMNAHGDLKLIVGFYENISERDIEKALENVALGYAPRPDAGFVEVIVAQKDINKLLENPLIYYVQEAEEPGVPENFRARTSHRTNAVQGNFVGARNYDGTGVVVAVGDDGDIGPHIDYTGRLTSFAGPSQGNHGDHVSGTVFGAGNLDPRARGMAPGAEIVYYNYSASGGLYLDGVDTMYTAQNVRITQSSYSNGNNAGYTSLARQMDLDIRQNRSLMHVFSAGNSGTSNFGYGAGAGWGNITGGHKQGKNVVTVANLTWNDVIATSSSRGPAHDGRIKPDIGAVGTDVYSTVQPQGYDYYTGTSMACPGTSGSLATLYHAYKANNNNNEPDGGLMKAILMNTADDIGNAGPDFIHGYGRINILRAAVTIEEDHFLTDSIGQGQSKTHQIVVPANTAEIRVMVYWTDKEATTNASRALVNNINFNLSKGSTSWMPWVLNPNPTVAALSAPAVRALDSLNNTEQVTITNPDAGEYLVNISGVSIPQGPQKYYVVYTFVANEITVTHPMGGEFFAPARQEIIRWDAPDGTGTFALEYSTNNGGSYQTIATVPANQRYFVWSPPATVTGQALVKITRGTQSAVSQAPFSIIGIPANISVDWACPDSIKLSWTAVTGATGYEVSRLGQKYMDSIGTTTTNSIVVGGFNPTKTYWLSVRALGANGCRGERAVAIEKVPGVKNCTLNKDLELVQIQSPILLPSCQNLSNTEIKVRVRNTGTTPLTNAPISYKIGNSAAKTDTIKATILAGSYYDFVFPTKANFSNVPNFYAITITNLWAADQNKYNDTLVQSVRVFASVSATVPYIQNFDNFITCSNATTCEAVSCNLSGGWINSTNNIEDDIDWRTNSGSTASANTGPTSDHTGNGKYLYTESSTCFEKDAILVSPCFVLTANSAPEASFWYHMWGAQMGKLYVDVIADGEYFANVVPVLSGNQGNSWQKATINLLPFAGQTVVFIIKGETGTDFTSDMAIDDFEVKYNQIQPTANFAASQTFVCLNKAVLLSDQSTQVPTSWLWTITPNTFSFVNSTTATSQNPQVSFSALGQYTITMIATNTFGADTIVKTNYVTVSNGKTLGLSENFDQNFEPTDWTIVNTDADKTWERSANAIVNANGNFSYTAVMNNFAYPLGQNQKDKMQLPNINLTGSMMPYLTFEVAYALRSSNSGLNDVFSVEISTDCGTTFLPTTYVKSGAALATVTVLQPNGFVPGASTHWRKDSISLAAYANSSIIIRFVNESKGGNFLYLDNVNVYDKSVVAPTASTSASADTICRTGTVTFTNASVGATGYIWNFGLDATPQFAYTAGPHIVSYATTGQKTVTLTATNAGGPDVFSTTVTVEDPAQPNFSTTIIDTLEYQFNNQSLGAVQSVLWNFGDGNTSTQNNPVHIYAARGTYTVTLSVTNSCGVADTSLALKVGTLGVNEIALEKQLILIPNPAQNFANLRASWADSKEVDVAVYDVAGKKLFSQSWQNATTGNDFALPISNWPDGVYIVRIGNGQWQVQKRLIIQH